MFFPSTTKPSKPTLLRLKEAALLAGVTEKKLRHELAEKTITPVRSEAGHPLFPARAVVFLRFVEGISADLAKGDRRDLYRLLTRRLSSAGKWRMESSELVLRGEIPARFSISSTISETANVLRKYRRARRRVISDPAILSGELVFEGTRIAVSHVGQLALRGRLLGELREDFPSLRDEDIEFARFLASLGNGPGRPRKALELRRGAWASSS